MNTLNISLKEMSHRKANFLLSIIAVAVAASTFLLTNALLIGTDLQTEEIIEKKETETTKQMAILEDDMRKHMKGLGFNIYIFPEGQDMSEVYDKGFATKTMPEEYATKLANSKIVVINHLLPTLTQKISWPEQKRTVVLIGIRGEVPMAHRNPMKPLIDPVEQGSLVLGYELHNSLNLKPGDKVKLMNQEFTIQKCHEERGNKDDITIWMNLAECQDLLDQQGRINAILALECNCATIDRLAEIRKEITDILPGTRIIEKGSQALARAEARMSAKKTAAKQILTIRSQRDELKSKRESLFAILVPLIGIMSLAGIGLLTFLNANDRMKEVGLFLAIGIKSNSILTLFLIKSFITGLSGGILSVAVSALIISTASDKYFNGYETSELMSFNISMLAVIAMPLFTCMASWLPSFWTSQQDPAEILRNE
jgi:putative ABC transport system permease protein